MSDEKSKYQPTVVTGTVRLSYPNLIQPNDYQGKKRWGATGIIENLDSDESKKTLADLAAVVDKATMIKWGKKASDVAKFESPIKDGKDKEDKDGYGAGTRYFRAYSEFCSPPSGITFYNPDMTVVDPMEAEQRFYAGCYVRMILTAYDWSHYEEGNLVKQGVSFSPVKIQFVKDGQGFRPQADPEAEFEALAEAPKGDDDFG